MMIYFLIGATMATLDIVINLWRGTLDIRTLLRVVWKNVLVWPLLMLRGFVKMTVLEMKKSGEL